MKYIYVSHGFYITNLHTRVKESGELETHYSRWQRPYRKEMELQILLSWLLQRW